MRVISLAATQSLVTSSAELITASARKAPVEGNAAVRRSGISI